MKKSLSGQKFHPVDEVVTATSSEIADLMRILTLVGLCGAVVRSYARVQLGIILKTTHNASWELFNP